MIRKPDRYAYHGAYIEFEDDEMMREFALSLYDKHTMKFGEGYAITHTASTMTISRDHPVMGWKFELNALDVLQLKYAVGKGMNE